MVPKAIGEVDFEVPRGLFAPKSYHLCVWEQGCALGRKQRSKFGEGESNTIQLCVNCYPDRAGDYAR